MKITKTIIFISLILALLYFRTFIWLINSWLTDPYYSHGFLIPIICGFIAWRNIREYKKGKGKGEGDEFKLNPEFAPTFANVYLKDSSKTLTDELVEKGLAKIVK